MLSFLFQTLWNLAFLESNKARIKEAGGIEVLTKIAKDANNDPQLIENAKGVLWMLGINMDSPRIELVCDCVWG